MQTVKQAIEDVNYVMGSGRSRVNGIARALIDAGILPKSSGRAIKKMDARQLSGFVAAVMMAEKIDEAPDVAEKIMNLRMESKPDGVTFKEAFAASMTNNEATPKLVVGKTQSGFAAELEGSFIHNGNLCEGTLPFWEDSSWGGWTRYTMTLSSEGFVILRNLFHREYDADGNPVYGES